MCSEVLYSLKEALPSHLVPGTSLRGEAAEDTPLWATSSSECFYYGSYTFKGLPWLLRQ